MNRAGKQGAALTRHHVGRRLRIVHREPRVSVGGPPRTGRGIAVADPGLWVRSLLQRLRRYLALRPDPALVFRHRGRGTRRINLVQHLHIVWAPRLHPIATVWAKAAARGPRPTAAAGRRLAVQYVSRRIGPATPENKRLRGYEANAADRLGRSVPGPTRAAGLLRRLLDRGVRIEAGSPPSAGSAPAPFAARAFREGFRAEAGARRIELVFKRPPASAGEEGSPTAGSAPGASERLRPPFAAAGSQGGGLMQAPNIDIHRLTDQVLTAIDRRVQAYRERTGRL
jgi:hypothetical protein